MATIKVKHFSRDVNSNKLIEYFAGFGTILRCKVLTDSEGNSKKIGFITFKSKDSAKISILALNGKNILGAKRLHVGFDDDLMALENFCGGNIFIKNLHENVDEFRLEKEFSFFGEIVSAKILKDKNNKHSGRGFVCFRSIEDAVAALLVMNGRKIKSQRIYTEFGRNVSEVDEELRMLAIKRFINSGLKLIGTDISCLPQDLFSKNHPYSNRKEHKIKNRGSESRESAATEAKESDNNSDDDTLGAKCNISDEESVHDLESSTFGMSAEQNQLKNRILQLLVPQIEVAHPNFAKEIIKVFRELDSVELIEMFRKPSLLEAKCNEFIKKMTRKEHKIKNRGNESRESAATEAKVSDNNSDDDTLGAKCDISDEESFDLIVYV